MKIAAASIAFSAQHSATSSIELDESLKAWVGASRPDFEGAGQAAPEPLISPAAYNAQAQDQATTSSGAQAINDAMDTANNDPILQLIRSMLEMLTGHAIRLFSDQVLPTAPTPPAEPPSQPATRQGQAQPSAGFGIEYDRHEVRTETERTVFQAAGVVRTADGKEVRFQLRLDMQRSYSETNDFSLHAGDARRKDPLVVNFGGTAAQLQNQRFKFDLAGNGQLADVPLLGGNSGYLALDLNGNGKIDSGRELFGAASGNGFADLAKLDGDGNGWIDENDDAFNRLKVWTPDARGGGMLANLQARNIGALYLGHIATAFELRGPSNADLGAVRDSGLYLDNNGKAGTLQQVDLTI